MAPNEAPIRTKLMAGAGLVCISTTMGVLYKASQAATGGFQFSTTSAITIAEGIKFGLSTLFHIHDSSHHVEGVSHVRTAMQVASEQLSSGSILRIMFLAFLYAMNNQLNFCLYMYADPGTIFLFKAASTLIVATTQWLFVGKHFTYEQWRAMGLQACGMVVVQYNPCTQSGLYSATVYFGLAFSALITAVSSVRNEFLVKNFAIGLNVQNAVLYSCGVLLNLMAFCFLPNPNSSQAAIGFFDGYGNPLAIAVVTANALIGLAITAVYKYADAVTKCFASDITAVLLCIISAWFFGVQSNVTTWCGVAVVVFAVHAYIEASQRAAHEHAPVPTKEMEQVDSLRATKFGAKQ